MSTTGFHGAGHVVNVADPRRRARARPALHPAPSGCSHFLAVAVISMWPAPTSLATTTVVRVGFGVPKVAL